MRDHADEAPELARRGERIVRPAEGIPVRAWVTQRQSGEARVDGEAVAWAGRQVHVRYLLAAIGTVCAGQAAEWSSDVARSACCRAGRVGVSRDKDHGRAYCPRHQQGLQEFAHAPDERGA